MPECYADTLMIETFVKPQNEKGYNHKKSINKVEAEFIERNNYKGKFIDDFAIGIVDKDKKFIEYSKQCKIIDQIDGELYLYQHINRHHYLIVIAPELEKWILKRCDEESLDLKVLNLPKKLEDFKAITKKMASKKNQDLINLFSQLNRSNNEKIERLKNWLNLIMENPFERQKIEIELQNKYKSN